MQDQELPKKIKDEEEAADSKAPPLVSKEQEYLNGWQRALADYQNLKKETDTKLRESQRYTTGMLLESVLPLYDTLNDVITHLPPDQQQTAWYQGLKHHQKQWDMFFVDTGLQLIPTEQAIFDPMLHEAVAIAHDTAAKDAMILKVHRNGYTLNNKVLRPSQVTVNKLTP